MESSGKVEDFRSDFSRLHPDTGKVQHFVVSITETEVRILADHGYVPCSDEVYGIVWKLLMDSHWVEKRNNTTLIDLCHFNEVT